VILVSALFFGPDTIPDWFGLDLTGRSVSPHTIPDWFGIGAGALKDKEIFPKFGLKKEKKPQKIGANY
jgi:hypothetical protein